MNDNESNNKIINIVIFGRGGQGGVTASQIIVEAAYNSGKFVDVHAYPSFGAERRGAPIQAYAKLSKHEKIWDRSQIETPDIVIILDESIISSDLLKSIEKNGFFIVNTDKDPKYYLDNYELKKGVKIITADMSKLAFENELIVEGGPVVNVPILGLLSLAVPELSLEDLKKVINKRLGERIGKRNIELMEKGIELNKTI